MKSRNNPKKHRPGNRGAKGLVALSCSMAVVIGSIGFASPAIAEESPSPSVTATSTTAPTPSGETPSGETNLAEAIGERGSFMGQSVIAKRQGVDVQDTKPANLMEAQALEPMAAGSWQAPGINGMDVSGWQPDVDWQEQWNMGARFAYVKATEGSGFTSDTFNRQYSGADNVGIIRGAYHFALPQAGNARSQARFFVNNGGGWTADGRTLPPLLDIEHNPYPDYFGNMCYNMDASQMVDWVQDFSSQVKRMTGRKPMIYTTYAWWTECTNNSTAVNKHDLHVAAYPYPGYEDGFDIWMFGGWRDYTMWQYSATGPFEGDSNHFNGDYKDLQQFATNGFADVTTSSDFYSEVMWADRQKITTGWDDGTFRPKADINRDAVAAFLYRFASEPPFDPPWNSPFKDYPRGSKFYKEVTWLESTGITKGWDDGTFRPQADVSREAIAAFLYRLADKPSFDPPRDSPFKDYPRGSKFYKEVTWLESTGITTGWEDETFRPLADIDRDAMAAFLFRYDTQF